MSCYGCSNRCVGCHAHCAVYLKEKEENTAKQRWLKEKNEISRSIERKISYTFFRK